MSSAVYKIPSKEEKMSPITQANSGNNPRTLHKPGELNPAIDDFVDSILPILAPFNTTNAVCAGLIAYGVIFFTRVLIMNPAGQVPGRPLFPDAIRIIDERAGIILAVVRRISPEGVAALVAGAVGGVARVPEGIAAGLTVGVAVHQVQRIWADYRRYYWLV